MKLRVGILKASSSIIGDNLRQVVKRNLTFQTRKGRAVKLKKEVGVKKEETNS